ncbi:DUF7601 domain-containing protein [Hugonella massiliensis]|uniref:DUF7601 domain-containing protein n=1 Tax=Hugonella massiliensis TaxID=1720315 RepID=UPI00073F9B1D|nr:DUF5979 domain-containing protein [Hugonella massiliensis]
MDVTHERRRGGASVLALVALLVCLLCACASPAHADEPAASSTAMAAETIASTSTTASSATDAASSSSSSGDAGASTTATSSTANEEAATTLIKASAARAPLADNVAAANGTVQIQYDTEKEIHYVLDPESANGRIILYCMNNQSHWPHKTPSISNVPSYIEGYLTPEKFKSQADYDACMNKLLAILYAGYPYNGLNMYTIVNSTPGITEDQFNALLNPPSWIRTDFPDSIGDTVFSYSDYPDNKANLEKLQKFVSDELFKYYFTGATTPSGRTSAEIRATPFYQAAVAMAYATDNETPLKLWDQNHSDADTVTEAGAYDATQYAIWAVLGDYGIEYNSLTSKSGEVTQKALAVKLLNYASADQVLRAEPDAGNVKIAGDSQFAYDPEYGVWKTGMLSVTEGTNYHGTYTLTLPSGVSAHEPDGTPVTKVTAGTKFFLASTDRPTSTDMEITASDTLTWLQEYRQYSPHPENYTASDGKNFQHMIGAAIKQKPVNATLALKPANEGSLTVSKSVVGEANSQTAFTFTVTLSDTSINGTYGDMTFTNGVASVTLKAGESATATHLPAGTSYQVAETSNADYASTATGASGTIAKDATATAAFTNTRLYKLTLSKTVSGQAASTSQAFTLHVTLKDASGTPLSGDYDYTGGSVSGSGATAPADGKIAFGADGTGSVTLTAGQQVTIAGIPSGTTYTVEETANTATDAPLYDATYNGSSAAATGALSADATVAVVNAVQEGELSVTKHVVGEVNSTREFAFTVKLGGSGAHLSGTFGDMTFTDGTATFKLSDGQTKTASALPAGATYTVTEQSDSDYATSSENAEGTIAKDATAQATFTNTRGAVTLPLSGQAGLGVFFLAGAVLLTLAAVRLHRRHMNSATKGGDSDEL